LEDNNFTPKALFPSPIFGEGIDRDNTFANYEVGAG
jgi:hypothetical protein